MDVLIGFAVAAIVIGGFWLNAFKTVRVSPWEQAGLFIDGGFERMLSPGRHKVFKWGRQIYVARVLNGPAYLSVGPIDAVTVDGLPIRLNATAVYRVTDAARSLQDPVAPAVQLAVSQALIGLAASERLETLTARGDELAARLTLMSQEPDAPFEMTRVALGAIVLPPELRRMVTEVERARLDGLATLERARGEQAALRALANAARMLKDNPDLLNLRLLQAVGTAGKGATLVLGEGALKMRD